MFFARLSQPGLVSESAIESLKRTVHAQGTAYGVRARLVSRRTATINQIRAFLIEQAITVRAGLRVLKNLFAASLEQRWGEISPRMRGILIGHFGDWP